MEPLRPLFSIEKRRIRGIEQTPEGETSFSPEKVIYIDIDDEVTQVFDKIKRARQKRLAIVVPKRAVVLQSIINLKILNKKIRELEKEIVLVTTDGIGLLNAEKAGIPALERIFEGHEKKEEARRPMPPRGERPVRVGGTKVSISEVIHTEKPSPLHAFIQKVRERIRKRRKEGSQTKLVFIAPNKQALFTLILVSVLLLLAITYIALPGATITLTPRATILDASFNVTFLDEQRYGSALDSGSNPSITLPSYKIDPPPFIAKITHRSTGKIFKGQNARGIITIINKSANPWDLAATTRFQTENGLVFRTPTPVRVPPSRAGSPGTLDVTVIADEFDASNQPIGTRGNIPPSKFFLPGIKNEENRKKLYGESKAPMNGGLTETVKVVTQEDLEAATQALKRKIAATAVDELKAYLEQQNLMKNTNLSLLTDSNILHVGEPTIHANDSLIKSQVEQFELSGSFTVSGIAYDRQELTRLLRERIITRVDPDKKIMRISEDDVSYRFLDQDAVASKVRLTVTMRAMQMYDLDPEGENGRRFIKKIADHIAGLRIEAAKEYLQQQTDEIAGVEITTWPIWAPTIPSIAENIEFAVKEDEGLQ